MDRLQERIAALTPEQRALLAARLEQTAGTLSAVPGIPRRRQHEPACLSFAQERMWFLDQFEPGNAAYNAPIALRLTGWLDVPLLEQSLGEVVRRHDVLRTGVAAAEGQPVQVVSAPSPWSLPVVDLSAISSAGREEQARQLATEETQRPFDLRQSPLMRTLLIRLGEQDHILVFTLHHLICDGWSLGVLVYELGLLYDAFHADRPSPLPELPIQYADYAVWQRKQLQGEALESLLSYWKQQLDGTSRMLELPADLPRSRRQTFRGARQSLTLPVTLYESLQTLSRREGVTLFMTTLAAFQTLLCRYTGNEDLVVGSPIANRNHRETEGLIGFFANTLALRTDLSGDPRFRELLGRVRETALAAFAHQDLPFEKLVEELQPQRDPSHQPLFQVTFALQNLPMPSPRLRGLSLDVFRVDNRTAKYDLGLVLVETEQGLIETLEYNTDLFDPATITRMLGHYRILLEGIVADPGRRLSELPLLTREERHRLLVEWNQTRTDYPEKACVHELFEIQAGRTPEAVAVVCEEQRLTYGELDRKANQLAHHLQSLGVRPGTPVATCLDRSLALVVGLLGILKAGAAYIPLDPEYPRHRLAFILEDSKASVLLTQSQLVERMPDGPAEIVCLDTDWPLIARHAETPCRAAVTSEGLAYVIYTSGSTGVPKGVAIPHRAVNRLVLNPNYIQLGSEEVVAQASNCSFDAATFEIWGALLNGARLVLLRKDLAVSPPELAAQIRLHGITTLFLTTPLFNQVARETPHAFQPLRHLLFGGEAVDPRWVREVLLRGAPRRLLHVYGPTETTTFATWFVVDEVAADAVTVPIGRPISNTEVYLLDARQQLVPIGVPGEICIGGPGLAVGYLNHPELTAERFIPHPFCGKPGDRLYRTGDIGRWRPDGQIEFLGRLDHQVKVRGFRVELGEIETVLTRHPGVREAVAVVRADAAGEKRLVAYVVTHGEPSPPAAVLRTFLQERLPEYMVPSVFVFLQTLPLTPNGKVDRRALPAPDRSRPDAESSCVAPRTPVESILAGIWAEVLEVERVGVEDNFFELGGHSLLATRVASRIRATFHIELPLRRLFEAPTVARLGAAIVEELAAQAEPDDLAALEAEIDTLGRRDER